MKIPTVHLNGTGKESLVNELATAHGAVQAAIDAVANVTVHGRDYYVQGPDAYRVARQEQDDRLARLTSVRDELLALALAISEQGRR